jgi:hypothetical protein
MRRGGGGWHAGGSGTRGGEGSAWKVDVLHYVPRRLRCAGGEEGGALEGVMTSSCEAPGEEGGALEGAMTSSHEAQAAGGGHTEGSSDVVL